MAGSQLLSNETPLLLAEIEALAKLSATQPHALKLKEYFNLCFSEARSLVILEEMKSKKVKLLSDCPKMSDI